VLPIASKRQGDAVAIVAGKVLIRAGGAIAVGLVGEILAVVLPIAEPSPRNAESVQTLELILGAVRPSSTMRLIRIVATIIVSIAEPVLANASKGSGAHYM